MAANTPNPAQPAADNDALARAAVEPVRDGMVIGLGTGRAASRAIHALARRAALERLSLSCVATSLASARLASDLGLRVDDLGHADRIDYLFDGADEIDPELRMLKGRGGAMTLEKIAAHAADYCAYLIDDSKLVGALGERNPLPVEILPAALGSVRARLHDAGLTGVIRAADNAPYRTDNGNPVLDIDWPEDTTPEEIALLLQDTPGVVGHGVFLDEADEILVEDASGAVRRRTRE